MLHGTTDFLLDNDDETNWGLTTIPPHCDRLYGFWNTYIPRDVIHTRREYTYVYCNHAEQLAAFSEREGGIAEYGVLEIIGNSALPEFQHLMDLRRERMAVSTSLSTMRRRRRRRRRWRVWRRVCTAGRAWRRKRNLLWTRILRMRRNCRAAVLPPASPWCVRPST